MLKTEAEHQERSGELQAEAERGGEGARCKRGDVAARHGLARREDRIAVVQRRDHQMMAVGGEQQRHPEHGQEVADQHALLSLRRIDRGDEAEPHLLRDHGTRNLERRQRHARGCPQHDADRDLMQHQHQKRRQRAHVDVIGAAMQRQDDQREQERDRQLHPRRDVGLAQARQQHHHRADPGEDEHEGRRKRRQQRDVDAHNLRILPQPPMIRDDIRSMWAWSESAMNGSANSIVAKMARIFGT
ncbi:hypothetical protein ACVWW6_004488 [Bradyrhizobium sp. USDA 3311]